MIESALKREFRERLQAGSLTPPGVHVQKINMHPTFESDLKSHIDALVEFSFQNFSNKVVHAVIELKSRLTPMTLEGAIHQVIRYRNEIRNSGRFGDLYPMLAAPYISESVRARCKEVGVGYIDLNGTFGLIHDNVYIDVVRPGTEFKNPQGIKNVFSAKSRRVIRVLLAHPYVPLRLEEISSKSQVSLAQAFQVTKRLQEQDFIQRTTEGRCVSRPRKLLRLFAKELKPDYAANRQVVQAFSELPIQAIAEAMEDLATRKGFELAFTLSSGLEPHERNLRQDVVAAYVSIPAKEIQRELRLEAVGKGPNVIIMTPPEADNTTAGGVFYERRTLSSGLVGVSPLQLYLDFSLQGGRGEEQADFLLEHSLGFHE